MNEEVLNTGIRKLLKQVGVTSQQEIQKAVTAALDNQTLTGPKDISVSMTLAIPELQLNHQIEGTITIE